MTFYLAYFQTFYLTDFSDILSDTLSGTLSRILSDVYSDILSDMSSRLLWLLLRTDPLVCPDCSIEDVLLNNMRREIPENNAHRQMFSGLGLRVFRVLGF